MKCLLFSEFNYAHCRVLDLEGNTRVKSTQLPNLWLRSLGVSQALPKVKLLAALEKLEMGSYFSKSSAQCSFHYLLENSPHIFGSCVWS